jgi:hypothetical protein
MALTAMLQKHINEAVRTLPDSETIMVPDGLVDTIRQAITVRASMGCRVLEGSHVRRETAS